METVFIIIIGLVIGLIFGWLIATFKAKSGSGKIEERASLLEQNKNELEKNLNNERNKVLDLNSKLSSLQSDYNNLQQKLAEQKGELEELQQKFTKEFENLANKIFKENADEFSKQSKTNLDLILEPFNQKIKDFEKKVQEVYVTDTKERASLVQQIKTLHELNQQMSQDAQNLTKALKGDSKTQGNWGEFILESLLEKSGLVRDREYSVQESILTEEGKRLQPDVIILLPDKKNIIIDSKVSLVAYEKYISSENEDDKNIALKDHLISIKSHLKNLSLKNYQSLYQLNSLDFILMFMPIEAAFSLAMQSDRNLFDSAREQNIFIVSPITLFAVLRTIEFIWKRENQNKNAIEIARQSGLLYDKFVSFYGDLVDVGKKIDSAKDNYESAMRKIHNGRGNLISSVEKIRRMGAQSNKSLPPAALDRADLEDEDN